MSGNKVLLLVAVVCLIALRPLLASTVQVGTCKPHLKSFSTISAAVSGVSAGSTIQVCPGTYAEQVTITQPVNLVGVTSGTANEALIAVPTAGLLPNTTSMFQESVAAQVLVLGAGPVNISDIAVDGTGGDIGCASNIWVAGIFYGSSSSGTVRRVRTSGQIDGACGVGIWAENGDPSSQSIAIQGSTVYNVDSAGIFVGSGSTPTLSVLVQNNVVNGGGTALAGILSESVIGDVTSNDLSNALIGVFDTAPGVRVGWNRITAGDYGVFLLSGGTAVSNRVSGFNAGIVVGGPGSTITGNRIVSSALVGVELGCFAAGVSGNLVNDAPVGIDQAPAGIGSNSFANTATTVTNACAVAAPSVRSSRSMAMHASSREQWHTPATPFGTRTK